MDQQGLTERELRAWRAFTEMQWLLMARIEQQLQASSGMSSADYAVLALLSEAPDGRLRPYQLARMAGWEKSRLHHQLTRMSTRGLITREQYGSRGMHAVITPKGLAALKEAVPGHAQEVRRLFTSRLTPDQLDQIAGIATTILDNLKAHQPSPNANRLSAIRTRQAAADVFVILKADPFGVAHHERALPLIIDPCSDKQAGNTPEPDPEQRDEPMKASGWHYPRGHSYVTRWLCSDSPLRTLSLPIRGAKRGANAGRRQAKPGDALRRSCRSSGTSGDIQRQSATARLRLKSGRSAVRHRP